MTVAAVGAVEVILGGSFTAVTVTSTRAVAVEVAQLAQHGQREGLHEHGGGEHPGHHLDPRVEILRNGLEGDGEDRDGEGGREDARQAGEQDPLGVAPAGLRLRVGVAVLLGLRAQLFLLFPEKRSFVSIQPWTIFWKGTGL